MINKKNILRLFHILLFAAFLFMISPSTKSDAMIVDGQVVPWDNSMTTTDTGNDNPRGHANPDDDDDDDGGDDVVPEGDGDDGDAGNANSAGTSNNSGTVGNSGNEGNAGTANDSGNQNRGHANPDDSSSNNNQSSASDQGNQNQVNDFGNSDSTPDADTGNINAGENTVIIDNSGNTTITTPAPKKEPGSFSTPAFFQKREDKPDPFEEGLTLSERVGRIWESLTDKEKKFLEIGGAVVALDIVYHIVKSLVKSILKSKKKLNNNKKKKGKNNGEDSDFERPEIEFEPKSVVTCLRDTENNRDLVDFFNKKKFIEEKAIGFDKYDELEEKLNDEKADLIVLDLNTMEEFEEFKKLTSEKDSFALIVDDAIYSDIEAELNSIKEEKRITGFISESAKKEAKLIKLVLPLFKPEINGENAVSVIGSVADALGIPYVSDILDAAMNGKEVIETIKEGDMDGVDKANVIGGIAAILGFDSVQEVTDIIDKVSMAKSVINHETIDGTQDATVNNE